MQVDDRAPKCVWVLFALWFAGCFAVALLPAKEAAVALGCCLVLYVLVMGVSRCGVRDGSDADR